MAENAEVASSVQNCNTATFSIVDCKVKSVVVYLDRAEVARTAKVIVEQGENEVVFKDLSACIDKDSIRVEGEGKASISEVSFETRHLPAVPSVDGTKATELREALKVAEKQLEEMTLKESRLTKQRQVLDTIANTITANKESPGSGSGGVLNSETVSCVVTFLGMYNEQAERLDGLLTSVQTDMEALRDEIESLKRNIREVSVNTRSKMTRQLSVLLDAAEKTEIQMVVSYVVTQASWLPQYDIRVFSSDGQMKIQYYGVIKQSTGEDWMDAKLSLSTAMPSIGGNIPELSTRHLKFKPKVVSVKKTKSFGFGGGRAVMARACAAPVMYSAPLMDNAMAEEAEPQALLVPTTEVREGIVSTMYEIARIASIPADNTTHRVSVAIIDLKPDFEHESVPQISAHAYVKAKVCNTSSYALLAGPSNIFLDNNFIAKANLKAVSPSEEFECSLGVDPAVKITYKPVHKFREQSGLFMKSNVLTYKQDIEVKNSRADDICILVTDQLPLSTEEKIKVTLLEPIVKPAGKNEELKPIRINGQNNVEWHLNVPAGETKPLVLKYSVEHPTNEEVI